MVNNRPYLLLLEENRFFLYINNMKKKPTLKAIILEGCPWSKALDELLKIKKIKSKIIKVNDKTKHKYKTDIIDTFPQLYFIDNAEYLIGGYTETKRLLDIINEHKENIDTIKNKTKEFLPEFTDKMILKLLILLT